MLKDKKIKYFNEIIELNNGDFKKIKAKTLQSEEDDVLETKTTNPHSLGIVNIFNNGFINNKPANFIENSFYWVLNIVTPLGVVLSKNSHPNICLAYDNKYFGLHASSDKKAFKKNIEIEIENKNYYICLDRIYVLEENFLNRYVVEDKEKLSINKNIYKKIIDNLNNISDIIIINFKSNDIIYKIIKIKKEI